jgi:thiamine pyrophosphokinase
MEGCLLIGGRGPSRESLGSRLEKCSIIVAADSGLEHAAGLGLVPTDIVGDFDSVDTELMRTFPRITRHSYSTEKDETDTELGLELLRERGAGTIHIVGGGGGRLDHLYALLSLFQRPDPPDHWYTHREHIQCIAGSARISLPLNKRVSFFPIGKDECRMRSSGLKWPLDSLRWSPGDFGISNRTTAEVIEVDMIEGKLIMMYDLGSEDRP